MENKRLHTSNIEGYCEMICSMAHFYNNANDLKDFNQSFGATKEELLAVGGDSAKWGDNATQIMRDCIRCIIEELDSVEPVKIG